MRHRLIAILLISAISLGMLFPGLSGVAKADSPTGYSIYWDDFAQRVWSLHTDINQESSLIAFLSACGTIIENPDSYPTHNVVVFEDAEGNLLIHHFERTNGDNFYGKGWSSPEEYEWWNYSGTTNSYFKSYGYIRYNVITHTLSIYSINQNYSYSARRAIIDLKNVTNPAIMFPMPFEFSAAGMKVYTARQIYSGNADGFTMPVNINPGSAAPVVEEFNLVTFQMGSHLYLTIQDQIFLSRLDPETMGLYLDVGMSRISGVDVDTQYFRFTYSDLMQIYYPGEIVNDLENVPTWGIYAIDIQGYIDDGYDQIFDAMLIGLDNHDTEYKYGQCVNVPFNLPSAEQVQQENNQNIWNTFNTYYETYNQTHVIPENLGEYLFGASGSKMYPCTVSFPTAVTDGGDRQAVSQGIHTFKWKFGSLPDDIGFDYNLLDVVIIPKSALGKYGMVYFYDDTLDTNTKFVDFIQFSNLIQSFDVIIIIPDDEHTLEENQWWNRVLVSGIFDDIDNIAVTGSSSMGIEYITDTLPGNQFQGFALLTSKAIQKQMLWNFNDGITKMYQLQVDYIDSEDKWKDSFLLWSASVFNVLDTCNGLLSDIIKYIKNIGVTLDGISNKLDTLISNTDDSNPDPWYLSLWNFISQFTPSNSDFANSLEEITTTFDDIPLLPEPSAAPTLPLIGG